MLQEFAGEGIPLLAAAASVDAFAPHLREMLPLIINKAVSQSARGRDGVLTEAC